MIAIVGNSGIGKTTLALRLAEHLRLPVALEQLGERPFQSLTIRDPHRYAFPNQVDYLLFRAEQEADLRQRSPWGILDGGLDLDYFGFTRLFHRLGYLTDPEADLCSRLYQSLRSLHPAPRIIVRMKASLPIVLERYRHRARPAEVAQLPDLTLLDSLIDDWLDHWTASEVLTVDASPGDPDYTQVVGELAQPLRRAIDETQAARPLPPSAPQGSASPGSAD